jgi:uncharacterized protein YqhQ
MNTVFNGELYTGQLSNFKDILQWFLENIIKWIYFLIVIWILSDRMLAALAIIVSFQLELGVAVF